jgi:NTP pyrophosphatase (non-canonical NTP hydrolase)
MTQEKNQAGTIPENNMETFHTFFKENYCDIEYRVVRREFLEIAERGLDELFADHTDFSKITRKNFIVYLRSEAYCDFEAVVIETFDAINSEIADMVLDVSLNMEREDEITGEYWETCDKLLKEFLGQLYEEKIAAMIVERTGTAG